MWLRRPTFCLRRDRAPDDARANKDSGMCRAYRKPMTAHGLVVAVPRGYQRVSLFQGQRLYPNGILASVPHDFLSFTLAAAHRQSREEAIVARNTSHMANHRGTGRLS